VSDAWYLPAEEYYIAASEADKYPLRQGDVLGGIDTPDGRWHACQVLQPTCELAKASVSKIQVVRVRPLTDEPDPKAQARLVAGSEERDGQIRPAFANTFFLAPVPQEPEAPLVADFREVCVLPRKKLPARIAAISHDCRVTFIRRYLLFRFRLHFSVEEVRAWEAARIRSDPAFSGPRPAWAL